VRVPELLEDRRLALEPGHRTLVAEEAEGDDLEGDRDELVLALLEPGHVHGAHGAAAELPLDHERADLLPDQHVASPAVRFIPAL
jgi:hypothetical protein